MPSKVWTGVTVTTLIAMIVGGAFITINDKWYCEPEQVLRECVAVGMDGKGSYCQYTGEDLLLHKDYCTLSGNAGNWTWVALSTFMEEQNVTEVGNFISVVDLKDTNPEMVTEINPDKKTITYVTLGFEVENENGSYVFEETIDCRNYEDVSMQEKEIKRIVPILIDEYAGSIPKGSLFAVKIINITDDRFTSVIGTYWNFEKKEFAQIDK